MILLNGTRFLVFDWPFFRAIEDTNQIKYYNIGQFTLILFSLSLNHVFLRFEAE